MWRLKIEQYFQVQDYALWDVIENGNSFKPAAKTTTNADGTSTTLISCPVTTEEKVQKKNDMKASKTRFGGNEATKKTQKTLLKQMLQKIVSQLAILGENISQEDLNLKLLRSLLSEWNTHVVVWRNKPDLDTMSFDDIYNNFKIVEQEVKGTTSSSLNSQNMSFVSSSSSTNEVNTAYEVSTANTQVSPANTKFSTASTQVSTANLSDDTVYAFLASQPNRSQLVYEDLEQIHEDDIEEMDLKWQLAMLSMRTRRPRNQDSRNRNQDSSRRTVNMKETSSKAMLDIDGAGYDWSYTADDEVPTKMALMAFLDSEPEFEGYRPKTSKNVSEDTSNEIEFVRAKQQEKPVRKPVKYAKMYMSQGLRGNQRNWNNQKSQQLGSDFVMYNKACFVCGSFDHVQANYNYHQRERVISGNNYTMVNYNYSTKKAHPSAHRNMASRAVLMKTILRPLNIVRPVNTAHSKTTVYSVIPMSRFSKSAQSTVKRPYQIRTALTNKNFSQKVNTAKGSFYTAMPNSSVVNVVRANQGHLQKEDQGYVDSGCSRHMTWNMSYLSDFKEFNREYVTFGGGAKGGKITGK
ncbi:hypothetical protein Tco_0810749 [Tanacetum coccineum]